jgi:anti-anti-sigma regulatory factor
VRFVDSAGLGVLLAIRERAVGLGIELTISRAPHPGERLL